MPVLTIPNQSPIGWIPGDTVGVEGGIEQYLPGGANQRITLRNVVTEFACDNTGVSDVSSTIAANVSSLNNNEVLYFPYGLYLFDAGVSFGIKRITVRGAGEGVLSTSSITIGTGTKTFTVASGLGWTAGIGIRIWHVQQRNKWLQGTVTSYSGTTLTVDVTSTSGTGTLALWTVGQSVMLAAGSSLFGHSGGSGDTGTTAITGSPSAGSTTLTVADGSGLLENGYCSINILSEVNGEYYHNNPSLRAPYTQYNWITDVTGNTVTLAKPIIMDLPVGRVPKITGSAFTSAYNIGHEYYAAFGSGTTPRNIEFVSFNYLYDSWFYHCQFGISDSYTLTFLQSVGCEVAFSYIGEPFFGSAPTASCVGFGGTDNFLMRHSIVRAGMVTEGYPDFNNAFVYNLGIDYTWTINHGAGSRFRIWEGNIANAFNSDGYHGGSHTSTVLRNWLRAGDVEGPTGGIIQARFNRYNNIVGNVFGRAGYANGVNWMGIPNSGNGNNDGVTVYPALYVSSGGVSGSQFLHDNPTGDSRLTGVLAAHSGIRATVTLDSPNTLENALTDPQNLGSANFPVHLVWGAGDSQQANGNVTIIRTDSSGATIVIEGADNYPSVSTAVAIKMGEYGHQEIDGSVEATAFTKKNYLYDTGGAPGGIDVPTDDTIPDSLVYDSQPSDWPGSIAWPPDIDPDSPNVGSSVIPAQVYYNTGEWPGSDPAGGSAVFTGSGSTTFTGSGSVTFD